MIRFKKEKSFAQAQYNFINAKQIPSQTVYEFTKAFNINSQKYLVPGKFFDKIKLTKFIKALKPVISCEMLKAGPDNFTRP